MEIRWGEEKKESMCLEKVDLLKVKRKKWVERGWSRIYVEWKGGESLDERKK